MKKFSRSMLLIWGMVVLLIALSCEKKEETSPAPEKASEEVAAASTIDTTALKQKQMSEELKIILKDLESKQAELLKRRAELENEIEALRSKQIEIIDMQAELKTFQIVSIVLLILGLIAIVVGGFMIFRIDKKKVKEQPVTKEKATKQAPKTEQKQEKEEKKAEKSKPQKPRTRSKKTPPAGGEEKK